MELGVADKTIKKVAKQRITNERTEKRMCSLLSRLAREEKGCPRVRDRFRLSRLRTPSVSWLGGTSPRSLPAPEFRTVARAEFLPPCSRAAGALFHRPPRREAAVAGAAQ